MHTDDSHTEFHSRQDRAQSSGTARIHTVLLRVLSSNQREKLEKNSGALGKALASLTFLDVIVLETGDRINDTEVSSLLESLRDTCGADVQHRICEDAHKLALQAKKSRTRSTGGGLLSPFWCLEEGAQRWRHW